MRNIYIKVLFIYKMAASPFDLICSQASLDIAKMVHDIEVRVL